MIKYGVNDRALTPKILLFIIRMDDEVIEGNFHFRFDHQAHFPRAGNERVCCFENGLIVDFTGKI